MLTKPFRWNADKDEWLRTKRGLSFELIVRYLDSEGLLGVKLHPNQERYPGQRLFVVRIEEYVYLVPFVEDETHIFLKTVIPSRKATRDYLRRKQ